MLSVVTLSGEGIQSSRLSGCRDCLMLCFSFVLQAGTSLYISVVWLSAVWVSRELILKLGNLSQGLGPWLKTRALLNQGKTAYWATENKNSSLQPIFELNHHFGMCSVIHLRRLIKCGCPSVVKISYPMDSHKKKAVLAGVLTIHESVLHVYTRKKSVLLKDLKTEEGCYQEFKPPWQT